MPPSSTHDRPPAFADPSSEVAHRPWPLPRAWFGLNYLRAAMALDRGDARFSFTSERADPRAGPGGLAVDYHSASSPAPEGGRVDVLA